MNSIIKEKDDRIRTLISQTSNNTTSHEPIAIEQPVQLPKENDDQHFGNQAKPKKQEIFENFLDLRKKLRRSIFRGEEVSLQL